MYESCQIIGDKQHQFAKQLMSSAKEMVKGPIDYRHSWVKMPGLNVTLSNGQVTQLCSAAMGYSFAAGTTDGPGMFSFAQGTTTGNPFWDRVSAFLSKPTEEEIACQAPKPILFNTADIDVPHEWDPETIPLQIIRLGNVFILSQPSEFTTMAGRRLRNAVKKILEDGKIVEDGQEVYVTIAGLANGYASYVVTYEEFQAQRYEAASTIYGPHELEGYIQEFSRLARDLVAGRPSATGPAPEDYSDVMIQLMPEAKFDRVPKGINFGDIVEGLDVKESYKIGEKAEVTFHAANPRNNQRIQGTYLTIEMKTDKTVQDKAVYKTVATDGDYATRFNWRAGPEDPLDFGVSKRSVATVQWTIPSDTKEGTYRICYEGDHKTAKTAKVVPFRGCSSEFTVSAAAAVTSSKSSDKKHSHSHHEGHLRQKL
jgi:neutral ceramidase